MEIEVERNGRRWNARASDDSNGHSLSRDDFTGRTAQDAAAAALTWLLRTMKVVDDPILVLQEAKRALRRRGWGQGTGDRRGQGIRWSRTGKLDLILAVWLALGDSDDEDGTNHPSFDLLYNAIRDTGETCDDDLGGPPRSPGLAEWNDRPGRKLTDVMKLLDCAIMLGAKAHAATEKRARRDAAILARVAKRRAASEARLAKRAAKEAAAAEAKQRRLQAMIVEQPEFQAGMERSRR